MLLFCVIAGPWPGWFEPWAFMGPRLKTSCTMPLKWRVAKQKTIAPTLGMKLVF